MWHWQKCSNAVYVQYDCRKMSFWHWNVEIVADHGAMVSVPQAQGCQLQQELPWWHMLVYRKASLAFHWWLDWVLDRWRMNSSGDIDTVSLFTSKLTPAADICVGVLIFIIGMFSPLLSLLFKPHLPNKFI